MLTIRLQRAGKKNDAQFRVVLAEKEAPVSKKFAEILGSYDPHTKNLNVKNSERLNYWISQNVEVSPTVHNLFVEKGILKASKVQAFKLKKTAKPEEKAAETAPAPTAGAGEQIEQKATEPESKPDVSSAPEVAAEQAEQQPQA